MIFSRLIALLMSLAPVTSFAQTEAPPASSCLVLIDGVESLFKETNRGFGPANVQILHDLTADFLSEQGFQAGSELISIEPHPLYTHSLTVEYSRDASKQTHAIDLVLSPLGENGVNAAATKVPAKRRVRLASAAIPARASKNKARQAREELFQQAEDQYFLSFKKLSRCD